jgi:hypothetical protein
VRLSPRRLTAKQGSVLFGADHTFVETVPYTGKLEGDSRATRDIPPSQASSLSFLLGRCSAIILYFPTGLEEVLQLTGKLWVQLFKNV